MSGRGGIYTGPGGQELYGDGREVNPVRLTPRCPADVELNIRKEMAAFHIDQEKYTVVGYVEPGGQKPGHTVFFSSGSARITVWYTSIAEMDIQLTSAGADHG
jgi:hypothetical protein